MDANLDEQRHFMLAAIINDSEDAIISKDLNSRVTSWNKSAERMFGYTETEMIGRPIHILIPADRLSEEDTIITSLKQGNRVDHFETIRVTKDGRELHISLTISPIRNSAGQVVGASKIARDISKQKQHEESLRVINRTGKAISAQLDAEAIMQTVTDASTQLSGAAFGAFFYNKVDASGESFMLFSLSGAPREAFEKFGMPRNTAVFATTFEGHGTVRSDDITKDPRYGHNSPHHGMPKGHLPVVSYLAVPVTSQTGVVIGGLFFGHPKPAMFSAEHEVLVEAIGAQASIALDNAKLYQEIQTINGKKDEFIGFASHELKTPLSTIKSYLQVANATSMKLSDIYPKVIKQVDRLENLVRELLDVSKIQAGKLDFQFTSHSLFKLIHDTVDIIDASQHKISLELPAEDVALHIDFLKMQQVLVNLLSNAVKYSDINTEITIKAEIFGDQMHISVKDKGVGIPQMELKQVFNQYYRIATTASDTKGIGLGLYICKVIVEAHSGKIWADSDVGQGSTFHVTFPIHPAQFDEQDRRSKTNS